MKAFKFAWAELANPRFLKDGSATVTLRLPEMSLEQKMGLLELNGAVCTGVVGPLDHPDVEIEEIKQPDNPRTPSQRLRGIMYRVWERKRLLGKTSESFQENYERWIESKITEGKTWLDENPA